MKGADDGSLLASASSVPQLSEKTALAVQVARRTSGVELISADAMAVYRQLEIGTAKPTPAERTGVHWHLVDVVDANEEFSVRRFQELVSSALAQIATRNGRAMLVGGTGLYHRAVIDSLEIPGQYPQVAAQLRQQLAAGGLHALYDELVALDPAAAERIEATNERRILRALEVSIGSSRPFSSFGPGLQQYRILRRSGWWGWNSRASEARSAHCGTCASIDISRPGSSTRCARLRKLHRTAALALHGRRLGTKNCSITSKGFPVSMRPVATLS